MQLEPGKVAVFTGGASGIGLAMAKRFAAEGMAVVLADIEVAALDAVASVVAEAGHDVRAVPTDGSDPESVEALADAAFARFGAVHLLCNNAGVHRRVGRRWMGEAPERLELGARGELLRRRARRPVVHAATPRTG